MSTWGPVLKRLQRQEPFDQASDAELIHQFLASQSAAAFEAIVRRHGPLVLRQCQRELPVLADAEDAFQATFLLLAQKARSIRQESSLAGWLAGVARRLARRLAVQQRQRRARLARLPHPIRSSISADQPSWWEAERRHLPLEYQTVIDLCLIQGLTRDEAARQLGQSPSAVHGLLYRARLKLKKHLIERGTLAGTALATAPASAAVIDRLAPLLAESAVTLLKQGTVTSALASPVVLSLLASRSIGAGVWPILIVSGFVIGGLGWWAASLPGKSSGSSAPLALIQPAASPQPRWMATAPEQPDQRPWNQPPQQPPAQQLQGKVQPNQNNADKVQQAALQDVPMPNTPNQQVWQQAQGGKDAPAVTVPLPVPPADRVPTGSERLNLAKDVLSSAGSLQEGMVPLLPRSEKFVVEGKTLLLSIVLSEQELRKCTEQAPPVQFPPKVQVANDPSWDGSMFQMNWNTDVLLVAVMLEEANSVTLKTLDKCWIAPDQKGVGHLLLSYDGKEQHAGLPGIKSYPYVMLKVPRKDLRQVAISLWRAGDKPVGVTSIPQGK